MGATIKGQIRGSFIPLHLDGEQNYPALNFSSIHVSEKPVLF
jgi:hypothetical protein